MAGGTHRLPIFQDDLTFQDRHTKSFQDLKDRMMKDSAGLHGRPGGLDTNWSRWNFDDDLDRLCGDFFQLRPSVPRRDELRRNDFGSHDSLDDSHNVYVENPQTKSRTFHMSFDVKDYSPSEISVRADGGNLVVEARHAEKVGEHHNTKEFSRTIKIPADVDIDKLTSTLSNDGILTVQAPVPPKYTSVAYVNPLSGGQSQNGAPSGPPYRARAPAPQVRTQIPASQSAQASPMYSPYSSQPTHMPPPQMPPPQQVHTTTSYVPQHQQQSQPQNARPSPPPPPQPQPHQSTGTSSSSSTSSSSWPPPPPPAHYEASPLICKSPPPLFEPSPPPPMPLDTPTFKSSPHGGLREMELALEVPKPFTPDDVVVKLEGKCLKVEGTHEEKAHGKASKSTMSRSFDLDEDLDPASVEAMLRSDGCLLIKGLTIPNQ